MIEFDSAAFIIWLMAIVIIFLVGGLLYLHGINEQLRGYIRRMHKEKYFPDELKWGGE